MRHISNKITHIEVVNIGGPVDAVYAEWKNQASKHDQTHPSLLSQFL